MDSKMAMFASDICSTSLALIANFTLFYLIAKKTPEELRPYAKILRQKCLLDTLFAIIIAVTFLETEIGNGCYIFFQNRFLKKIPHPWNGMLTILYIWCMYFCISADFIPFYYRYILLVKGRKISTKELYILYVITGLFASVSGFGCYLSFWPSTLGKDREEYEQILGNFWKNEAGNYPIYVASRFSNPYLIALVFYCICLVSGAYSLIFYFGFYTLKHLKANRMMMFEKTRKMQRNLTFTLVAQACVPMFSAVIPIIIVLLCLFLNFSIKHLGPVLVFFVNWVVVLNPICVIVFIAPYRDAVREKTFRIMNTMLKWLNLMPNNNVAPTLQTIVDRSLETRSINPII